MLETLSSRGSRTAIPMADNDVPDAAARTASAADVGFEPSRLPRAAMTPRSSVTTVRTFSMSSGLEASTVTPGSTAPVVSFTVPAIPLPP